MQGSGRNSGAWLPQSGVIAPFLCTTPVLRFRRNPKKRNGRHEETRTPDLYRVKVAL
jgi:hypothetical protein